MKVSVMNVMQAGARDRRALSKLLAACQGIRQDLFVSKF